MVSETWLHSDISDVDVIPPSYQIFRRDRTSRGGGVAIILKNSFAASALAQIDDHESLFLKVNCWGHVFVLCAVYRPPSSPPEFLSLLRDHMSSLKCPRILMAGDFNLPSIKWSQKLTANVIDSPLYDIMLSCDLQQVVLENTRVIGNHGSILDLVFLNRDIPSYDVAIEEGISDHKLVLVTCKLADSTQHPKTVTKTVKDMAKADDQSILDVLWQLVDQEPRSDVISLWLSFKHAVLHCLESFVPDRHVKTRRANPWVTRDIVHIKRKLKRAKKKSNRNPDGIQQIQAELSCALTASRDKYFSSTLPSFLKNNPEKFWQYLGNKAPTLEKLRENDLVVTDLTEISNIMNDYLHSVFSSKDTTTLELVPSLPDSDFISFEGVLSLLLGVKEKSSGGPDGIPNSFLRRYAEPISHILTTVFSESLKTATLPDDWRLARVVAVHKKGDRLLKENYRPISLTSTCCKVLEHIIAHFITDFLENNNLLSPAQHGFRKKLSTCTQLVATVHDIAQILDFSGQVDLIFLDFSKAFDRVPHGKLLIKLRNLNVPSFIISWIEAYLSNRAQYVDVGGHISNTLPVLSGVPQGSVLGPILFLIYINDIADMVESNISIRLFADDCVVYKKVTCQQDQVDLSLALTQVSEWCTRSSMTLNSDKTVLLRVTRKKQPFTFTYNVQGTPVREVNEYKYLGVTITNTLSWSAHITNVSASASRKLGFLRHKLKKAPPKLKMLAYKAYILPKLEYASVVWDPFYKKDIQKLEMVQRRAVRFIFSKFKSSDSPTKLMKDNDIPVLEDRRRIARLKFLHSIYNGKLNIPAHKYIQPFSPRASRHRHMHNLLPYTTRTNTFKNSFFPRTIIQWNSLPPDVISSDDFEKALLGASQP